MPRASYRIIPINEFSYEVRVDKPNAGGRTITGFHSLAEAENWIEIQKRHEPRWPWAAGSLQLTASTSAS
jgi:hypothetical protein